MADISSKPILVTGGAGFIGSCFVRQWIAKRRGPIVNLDVLTYAGNLESLKPVLEDSAHTFIRGDICDAALIQKLLQEHQPQAIIHLAAESHVDRSIDEPASFIQTNVVGTSILLEQALRYWETLEPRQRDLFRFLHVSTDEVYGSLESTQKFTESSPYAPSSPYSASKAAADHLVRAYHRTYELPVLISNSCNNYGPYQFPEKLIPLMTLNALEGKPLPLYGDGLNVRDWIYVEDQVEALLKILDHGRVGQVYNVAANCQLSNLEVVQLICQITDRLCKPLSSGSRLALIEFVADRPGHDRCYGTDATKLRSELGWEPRESFESGLEKTVRWYHQHLDWVQRVMNGKYHGQRLGLFRHRGTR